MLKIALCTISFRHQLVSFPEIVNFALDHQFEGIELWGAHADSLYEHMRTGTERELQHMQAHGCSISMVSDYLNIAVSDSEFAQTLVKCDDLIQLAKWLGTTRIRTFAGQIPSDHVSTYERRRYTDRLRQLCERCCEAGIQLIVEIHPGTLADRLISIMELLYEVGCDHLRLNFDVLHVWEFGGSVERHYEILKPWVDYFHLKNMKGPECAHIFEPGNVYSASGSREGIALLGDGVVDYAKLLDLFNEHDGYAALEWFGPSPFNVLKQEIAWLRGHQARQRYVNDKLVNK